jgi:hypothetical protein
MTVSLVMIHGLLVNSVLVQWFLPNKPGLCSWLLSIGPEGPPCCPATHHRRDSDEMQFFPPQSQLVQQDEVS